MPYTGYDAAGNKLWRRSEHDSRDSQRFAYDSSARLVSYVRGDFPDTADPVADYCAATTTHPLTDSVRAGKWQLDGAGNWLETVTRDSSGDTTEARTANRFNEYTAIGATAQTHDDNGNLTGDGSQTYTWDALGRLRQVKNATGTTLIATYCYDIGNRRIRKDVPAGADIMRTEYYYSDWQVVEERYDMSAAPAPALKRQFVYGIYIDEPLVMDVNGNSDGDCTDTTGDPTDARYFYHQNALASVAALTDPAGKVVEAYAYDPYGRHIRLSDGNADGEVDFDATDTRTVLGASLLGNPYTFTARRFDPESGLHYYRNRVYSASRGTFISRDPIGFEGGINPYEYAHCNPVRLLDPLGLFNTSAWKEVEPKAEEVKKVASRLSIHARAFGAATHSVEAIGTSIPCFTSKRVRFSFLQVEHKIFKIIKAGLLQHQKEWAERCENDHVRDFKAWAYGGENWATGVPTPPHGWGSDANPRLRISDYTTDSGVAVMQRAAEALAKQDIFDSEKAFQNKIKSFQKELEKAAKEAQDRSRVFHDEMRHNGAPAPRHQYTYKGKDNWGRRF